MDMINKIENKIDEFLKEINYLKEENTMLKIQLRNANKTKDSLTKNNQEIYSKIKLALKTSQQE